MAQGGYLLREILFLFLAVPPAVLASSRSPVANPSKGTDATFFGSGLQLPFPALPGSAYCLLTDPCIHVNALIAGDDSGTWVSGYAVMTGEHMVTLQVTKEEYTPAVTIDGESVYDVIEDNRVAESKDEEVTVEIWSLEKKEILVIAKRCHVRLLLTVRREANRAHPVFSMDMLDWDSLDAPHGIIGQTFPNRARPEVFSTRARRVLRGQHAEAAVSTGDSPREPGALWSHSTQRVIGMLAKLRSGSTELDGVPGDYLASGLLDPDCVFSRFDHEWKPEQRNLPKPKPVALDEHGAAVERPDALSTWMKLLH